MCWVKEEDKRGRGVDGKVHMSDLCSVSNKKESAMSDRKKQGYGIGRGVCLVLFTAISPSIISRN